MNFVAATVVIGLDPIIAVSKVMNLWHCVKKSDRSAHSTCVFSGLTTEILESQRAGLKINYIFLIIERYYALYIYVYVCIRVKWADLENSTEMVLLALF